MQEREPPRARCWASNCHALSLSSPVMASTKHLEKHLGTALGGPLPPLYSRRLANRFSLPLQGSAHNCRPPPTPRESASWKSSPFIKARRGLLQPQVLGSC